LVHDLRVDGDGLLDDLQILQERFQVDMSNFRFDRYSPSEVSVDTLLALFPLMRRLRYAKYRPITLDLIERSIAERRWPDPED
jgi:hypothetical protein